MTDTIFMPSFPRRAILLATVLMTLSACASRPEPVTEAETAPEEAVKPSYSAQTFADLLIAEVSAQRNVLGVTLSYYAREASASRDPKIAEQAARLAAYLDDPLLAIELGDIWLAGDPGNAEAHELLAIARIHAGDVTGAAGHIDFLLKGDPDQALMRLVGQSRGLNSDGNAALLSALASLTREHPKQAPLWYAKALHQQQQGELEAALASTNKALSLNDQHEDALLLKARLLYQMERKDQAWRHLSGLLRRYPDAKRVRVLYIRLLLEDGQRHEASEQLAELTERHPEDQELRFSLALFGMEQGARKQASNTLKELLDEGFRPDDMRLYLARAAELDQDPAAAIEHYMQVGSGESQMRARVQAARLLYQTRQDARAAELMAELRDQQPDQIPALYAAEADMLSQRQDYLAAMALLNEAVNDFPNQTDLLYARAMTAEKLDNLGQLEADLRRMLELKPDDSVALNALGYTLADRTDRHQEAFGYISRALEQRPTDPAVMDSMGWVLYRLGQPDEALPWLQKAWKAFPDPEVASHLGEVLWVLGQQDEARRIWREAMELKPDNTLVPRTVERLTGSPQP
ncbi:MAG: tetratricopeptide repeat protein [Alcanivoracaceae bacterium]|jgi:tetratricopeptide (TPR) repeat protein|nr:tetratricopeptide repeat protein [Alcanivoracaceae bacterium]